MYWKHFSNIFTETEVIFSYSKLALDTNNDNQIIMCIFGFQNKFCYLNLWLLLFLLLHNTITAFLVFSYYTFTFDTELLK